MDDHHHHIFQPAQGNQAFFPVVLPVILRRQGNPLKNLLGITEIQAVLPVIGPPFDLIPFKFHIF
jgi:hypothetical protein